MRRDRATPADPRVVIEPAPRRPHDHALSEPHVARCATTRVIVARGLTRDLAETAAQHWLREVTPPAWPP